MSVRRIQQQRGLGGDIWYPALSHNAATRRLEWHVVSEDLHKHSQQHTYVHLSVCLSVCHTPRYSDTDKPLYYEYIWFSDVVQAAFLFSKFFHAVFFCRQ